MNRRSIAARLILFYCTLLLLLGVSFSLFTIITFDRYTSETIRENISARANEIWRTAQPLLNDRAALSRLIELRFSPETLSRFIRISSSGTVLYQSARPSDGSFSGDAVPLPVSGAVVSGRSYRNLFIYTHEFITPSGRPIDIESGQSDDFAAGVASSLTLSLLIGLPALLLLAAVGGYVLIRRAWRPVEAMINAAEAITFNDPRNRLPLLGSGDRIEALGQALNRMLDRLDNAYQHASRFSADAAHELRTPLAIIRGELEMLAERKKRGEDIQAAIGNVLEEVARLGNTVDSLITLARMDALWGKNAHAPVNISRLARDTIDQMQLLADEKNIKLHMPEPGDARVAGDKDRLKQVLVNLIDNAIKYTPVGGGVAVRVSAQGDHAELLIEDTGIGITPQDIDYIFDRFFRVSTDRGETGAGLGLAIVRAICHAHGGTVTAESVPGVGSTFRVTLPLSGESVV